MPEGKITFLGAAGTVTGSKFMLELPATGVLVDCGLFQGLKKLRLLNWEKLPVSIKRIQHILLTHAHLDHCGYLPCLVKQGFNNSIYGTPATLELTKIILADSAKIQQEDAEKANLFGYTKHKPALPLYTTEDVEKTITLLKPVDYNAWHQLDKSNSFRFRNAGHILGASFIEIQSGHKRMVFSGDIGNNNDPLINDPDKPDCADILLIESTYGNRLHQPIDLKKIAGIINRTLNAGGTVIVPGFAVERAQLLMYYLVQLKKNKLINDVPVFLDSPMAIAVLNVLSGFIDEMKIGKADLEKMMHSVRIVEDYNETLHICQDATPKIIIAASGMATGGRVLTYFDYYLSSKRNTILLAGYQAEGTRGRLMLDGAEHIKFFGRLHKIKARVEIIEGLSAHADQDGLINWLSNISNIPESVFIVHGEQEAAIGLQKRIKKTLHWDSYIPQLNEQKIFRLE